MKFANLFQNRFVVLFTGITILFLNIQIMMLATKYHLEMIFYILSILGFIGAFLIIYRSISTSFANNLVVLVTFITHVAALFSVANKLPTPVVLGDGIISMVMLYILISPPKGNFLKIMLGIGLIVSAHLFSGLYVFGNLENISGNFLYWSLWVIAAFIILGMKLIFDGYHETKNQNH